MIIFEIEFVKNYGLFYMTPEYTAYPDEDEVLIQDGLEYQVLNNSEKVDEGTGKRYVLIKLRHPVDKKRTA